MLDLKKCQSLKIIEIKTSAAQADRNHSFRSRRPYICLSLFIVLDHDLAKRKNKQVLRFGCLACSRERKLIANTVITFEKPHHLVFMSGLGI